MNYLFIDQEDGMVRVEPVLSIWVPKNNEILAKYIHDYLVDQNDSGDNGANDTREGKKNVVYYIDSINSFPIYELQNITKRSQKIEVFDQIQMITCLDMIELEHIIDKIIKDDAGDHSAKILIHGINTMMTNTMIQMNSNKNQSYSILNKALLKLRYYDSGTRIISDDNKFFNNLTRYKRRRGNDKKSYSVKLEDRDIMEYINTYYCDEVL